jgi:xylulokinase
MPVIDCGIDIGSTNVKVVFLGDDGRVLHARSIASPRISDGMGPVTDALALVATLEGLIIEGWKQLGSGAPIRSIAAAGVGEDGVGITTELRPTGHALPWFDKRASKEVEDLSPQPNLIERAGIGVSTERTAAKWLWLFHNRPQELSEAACWVALTD